MRNQASKSWVVSKRWSEVRTFYDAIKAGLTLPGGLPPFPEHVKQAVLTLGNGSRRRRAGAGGTLAVAEEPSGNRRVPAEPTCHGYCGARHGA